MGKAKTISEITTPFGPIDTHSHLDELKDSAAALARAREAGLAAVVGVGMGLDSNRSILTLAEDQPDLVLPALGAHPWNVKAEDWRENAEFVAGHLASAAALGEVGLDYKVKVDKSLQRRVLSKMLALAAELDKPVLLHARFSQNDCLEMLIEASITRCVFHWYSGPLDILDRILDAGYHVSATPALAYSPPHREALAHAPMDRILVETDSPVKYQGKASEPADVLTTIRLLAELRGMSGEETAARTTANARAFFGL